MIVAGRVSQKMVPVIKQLYAQTEKSGGFLQVTVTPDKTAEFSFHDDRGALLYKAVKSTTPAK